MSAPTTHTSLPPQEIADFVQSALRAADLHDQEKKAAADRIATLQAEVNSLKVKLANAEDERQKQASLIVSYDPAEVTRVIEGLVSAGHINVADKQASVDSLLREPQRVLPLMRSLIPHLRAPAMVPRGESFQIPTPTVKAASGNAERWVDAVRRPT